MKVDVVGGAEDKVSVSICKWRTGGCANESDYGGGHHCIVLRRGLEGLVGRSERERKRHLYERLKHTAGKAERQDGAARRAKSSK